MAALIGAATGSVCLESYMVKPGEPAQGLLAALLAARARGVRVQVLHDAFGSEGLPPDFFAALVAAGGEVRVFSPARRLRLAFRDHRKLLVCDARRAIVGGHNIGPEYMGDGLTHGWFDVALQIEGPVAADLAASFAAMYALAPMNPVAIRDFRRAVHAHPVPAGPVRLLNSGPGWRAGLLSRVLRLDVRQAREVRCMAGYFLPPTRMRRALRRCTGAGGRVELLLAGRSDVPVARYAAEHLYARMLEGGAHLYEYQPQVLHAKLFIVDDTVYVGSCNLDRRSLSINYELLLRLQWPELAARARALFGAALAHSREVPLETWCRRRQWWERWRSRAAYWLLTRIDPLLARRPLRSLG
ncbi:MAG TPA: phosphatidylserine/phosphatidylglycerophosphate/cardiolipin synthase family protein [Steroidobacteraceae bacterium]|nr:phosphatidylserine/phosphatidylglycerophosphate/cardiolipin synthase family protein [Steroidobacteraceae bacterium]